MSAVERNWMRGHGAVRGMVVLVAGGGSGIGAATARMFAANGAQVMIADRNAETAAAVAREIGGHSVGLDLSRPEEVAAAVEVLRARFGRLDALVNTAAFVKPGPLEEVPLAEFRKSLRVNVQGALDLARACLPLLKESPRAAIVQSGSLAGRHGYPRGAGYGPSKAALMTLTRQMGLEWAAHGIRVNAVIPGMIDTPLTRGPVVSDEVRARRVASIPMRRLGQPEEVASLILYLASPAASYLTADTYGCDGGQSEGLLMASFTTDGGAEETEPRPPAVPADDWMTRSPVADLAALVVGGGSGIGAAVAEAFAANGGSVMVADRDGAAAQRMAETIRAAGGRAEAVEMDLARAGDSGRAVTAAQMAFGRLDSLVNCAALVRPAPLEAVAPEDWENVFEVNVTAALVLARAALPALRRSPAASIVNVGSLGALWGRPNGGAYGPSKAALITLSKQMALEWAADGIRVNAVTPGTIDTPLCRATVPAAVLEARAQAIPMRRLGTAQEMADLILYLMSPAASYVTAQVFNCDGGHAQATFFVPMGT